MKKILLLTIFTFLFSGCSSTTDIKDWLKEGTREHQENEKKSFKTGKTKLKDYLEKNGCISGSSAKPIETKDKNGSNNNTKQIFHKNKIPEVPWGLTTFLPNSSVPCH